MNSANSPKTELRRRYLSLRDSLDKSSKEKLDRSVCGRISSMSEYVKASYILLYAPFGSEADVMSLFYLSLELGKKAAFPRCLEKTRTLVFQETDSPEMLIPGKFGIPTPCEKSGRILEGEDYKKSLCIVPALSVDSSGYRLGYGGGYYDRFLSDYPGQTVSPVYSFLLSERLPYDSFDIPVGYAVTEDKILKF